ncbi:MAG TPA: hypothetical protein VLK30_01470 [Candidatus Limnocylindrales bacterium]|nr:hypothetical protein [Candidatus Limnocylindrales bacterium]
MSESLVVALIVLVAVALIAIVAVLARNAGRPRLRALPDESRNRFARAWQLIEARFIEDPRAAVQEAERTVVMILGERGANLVEPKRVPDDLRKAREASRGDQAGTEGLRVAMVHYKRIVDDAVGASRLSRQDYRREIAS